MMKNMGLALILLTFGFGFTSDNIKILETEIDCRILHEGTFKYLNGIDEVKVVIEGNKHTEYHNRGKYIIKSKLEWLNDCEYNMTLKKVTIPNFPYGKGDVMNVKVNEIKEDQIFFTSTVNGDSWDSKLIKVK